MDESDADWKVSTYVYSLKFYPAAGNIFREKIVIIKRSIPKQDQLFLLSWCLSVEDQDVHPIKKINDSPINLYFSAVPERDEEEKEGIVNLYQAKTQLRSAFGERQPSSVKKR